jgi:hypothetical protein
LLQLKLTRALHVNISTITRWKVDPRFQDLLYDYQSAQIKHQVQPILLHRLSELFALKRETQEDRKLLAQVAGMISDGTAINVQVGVQYRGSLQPK